MTSTAAPAPRCPRCGNGLFHCGLAGWPHWCGACDWRGTPASATPRPAATRFWVVCSAYERGPFKDRATAERELGRVEALGACSEAHEVKERPAR